MKLARVRTVKHPDTLALVGTESVKVIDNIPVDAIVELAMARPVEIQVGEEIGFDGVRFLPPIRRPASVRDFSAFEAHTKNIVEGTGGSMNPLWYEFPIFYFSNPNCIIGDSDPVTAPRTSNMLDFELEVACVVGKEVRDLSADAADWPECLAGFMLMNDWSARDIGVKELKLLFGPAKAKDFATSFGPWLTTTDEFEIREGRFDLPLTARVNGELWSTGNVSDLHFSWPRILARASADCTLYPGDIIGSGTCGTGCILDLRVTRGRDKHPWLKPGDLVELSGIGLGTLRNTVAPARR